MSPLSASIPLLSGAPRSSCAQRCVNLAPATWHQQQVSMRVARVLTARERRPTIAAATCPDHRHLPRVVRMARPSFGRVCASPAPDRPFDRFRTPCGCGRQGRAPPTWRLAEIRKPTKLVVSACSKRSVCTRAARRAHGRSQRNRTFWR